MGRLRGYTVTRIAHKESGQPKACTRPSAGLLFRGVSHVDNSLAEGRVGQSLARDDRDCAGATHRGGPHLRSHASAPGAIDRPWFHLRGSAVAKAEANITMKRKPRSPRITRRTLLQTSAGLAITGVLAPASVAAQPARQSVYEALGVRHVINATGTVTNLGGSLMP